MNRLHVTTHRLRERLDDNDLPTLTERLPEAAAGAGIIAHHQCLDGKGGVVCELPGHADQDFAATGGHGHEDAKRTQMLTRRVPGDSRSSCAPAYYLGRPASLWLSVTSPRRRRNPPKNLPDAATDGRDRTPSQPASPFDGAGSETADVTPGSV